MRRDSRRGSSIVELSVALPVLITLFLGTFQFGYAYYVYNELEQSVRAGARHGSLQSYDGTTAGMNAIILSVRKMVVYGNPDAPDGSTPIVKGLGMGNVDVSITPSTGRPTTVRVSIQNFSVGSFWSMTPSNKPTTEFPYLGIYTGGTP